MSFKKPFRIDEIDINKIKFTNVKTNSKKTIIYMKYDNGTDLSNLVFQSPSLFNINEPIYKNNNYELDIPLHGKYDDKINEFISFLTKLDKKIMDQASKNPKWFNNFTKTNKIKYQKTIRESDDKRYNNGMIRIKLIKSNKFQSKIKLDEELIDIKKIEQNSCVKIILEAYAIWINENGFGLFLRPILLSFKKEENVLYNYELMEDSDELDDIIHTVNNENSIFIKSELKKEEINNTTSILELPSNDNYFEEMSDSSTISDNNQYSLSSTSTTK